MDSHRQGALKHGAASAVDAFGDERIPSHSPEFNRHWQVASSQIVIVDEQLADPLDMFPSESTESEAAQPAAAVLDILEQDQFRPSTQLPLPPTRYHARQSTNHRLVVVCMIAVSVLVLLGRSALLRRSEVPARSSDVSVQRHGHVWWRSGIHRCRNCPHHRRNSPESLGIFPTEPRSDAAAQHPPRRQHMPLPLANLPTRGKGRQPLREARNTIICARDAAVSTCRSSTDAAIAPPRSFEPAPLGEPRGI